MTSGMNPHLQPDLQRIFVRSPNWIGDQVMAYPFFYYLRKRYPRAKIVAFCLPWVSSIQYRNLVDHVELIDPATSGQLRDKWDALKRGAERVVSHGPWDLAILLTPSFSSAAQFALARRKQRRQTPGAALVMRGYRGDGRGWLIQDSREPTDPSVHRAQSYLDLLGPGTGQVSGHSPGQAAPSLVGFWPRPAENPLDPPHAGEQESFDPLHAWKPEDLLVPPSEPYWVLCPGSQAESRRWDPVNFAQLARMIHQQTGLKGLIFGGLGEMKVGAMLASDADAGLEDWTARASVAGLSEIFRRAKFVVSNDSGLAHVAALCGARVYIIWGAGDPRETQPLGPGQVSLVLDSVECWPCRRNRCSQPQETYLQCLKGISARSVWEQIRNPTRSSDQNSDDDSLSGMPNRETMRP